MARGELLTFSQRYVERCNEHRFDDSVTSSARRKDARLRRGLRAVIDGFPDYRWELQRLLVDGRWLAARLSGTGARTRTFRGIAATRRTIRMDLRKRPFAVKRC